MIKVIYIELRKKIRREIEEILTKVLDIYKEKMKTSLYVLIYFSDLNVLIFLLIISNDITNI